MPSLNDIANLADSLEKAKVAVIPERCVKVRNRHGACTRCVDICQAGALDIHDNELHYSTSACVDCGACTAVCPTEALVSLTHPDDAIAASCDVVREACGGQLHIACARMAAKRVADPAKFAEVPCLAHLNEAVILQQAARGAERIVLIDGGCGSCKYGWTESAIDIVADSSAQLVADMGGQTAIVRTSVFPPELLVESTEGMYGSTRRGFFSDTAATFKETALTAANATIQDKLGAIAAQPTLGERLRVADSGVMPQFSMVRHERAINALDAIGAPCSPQIESRLFGAVHIDTDLCNACGMCATFCPSGALTKAGSSDIRQFTRLEFMACECVQCGLCADVCWKDCLRVDLSVPAHQLFSFDPAVFKM